MPDCKIEDGRVLRTQVLIMARRKAIFIAHLSKAQFDLLLEKIIKQDHHLRGLSALVNRIAIGIVSSNFSSLHNRRSIYFAIEK